MNEIARNAKEHDKIILSRDLDLCDFQNARIFLRRSRARISQKTIILLLDRKIIKKEFD